MFLFLSLPLCGANRHSNIAPNGKLIVRLPEPSKTPESTTLNSSSDDLETKTDVAIFNHFITILAHFGYILLDPQNTFNVTLSAAKMIDGVVAVAQELTKRGNPPTDKQVRNMVRLILSALQKQGYLPQKPNQITDFGYSIS